MTETTAIFEDRPLTGPEAALIRWLLEHGTAEAARFLPQLDEVWVESRCPCGCPSIDFALKDRQRPRGIGMQILADFVWKDSEGHRFGVYVFAKDGMLAGLDVWSVDGLAEASTLPKTDLLQPSAKGWD